MKKMFSRRIDDSGFSIIEVISAIAISSILLAVVENSYSKISNSLNKSMTLEQIKSDFSRARSLALSKSGRVVLLIDNDNNSYSFGIDYAPFNSPAAADSNLFQTTFPKQISVVESETIIFGASGKLIDESGDNNQVDLDLKYNNVDFANLTVYLSGFIEAR